MKSNTTKAAEAKKSRYMTLQKASTYQLAKSLYFRLDVYLYALVAGMVIGLAV